MAQLEQLEQLEQLDLQAELDQLDPFINIHKNSTSTR
jgi:hypothetical protein